MRRLILTTSDSSAGRLRQPGIADAVVPFGVRFSVGEPLPSEREIANALQADDEWLSRIFSKHLGETDSGPRMLELCEAFDTIDLWIDPDPNAQLILVWLLDHFRPHAAIVARMNLVQAEVQISDLAPDDLAPSPLPVIKIASEHLETARAAWQAYRGPTPQAWFDLLATDLSALPRLRETVMLLLEELPQPATGLGATEMRMLELISEGNCGPYDVFSRPQQAQRTACIRLLGDRRAAGRTGALSRAAGVGPGRRAVHSEDARGR